MTNGLPNFGQPLPPQQTQQALIVQQVGQMASSIFVRAAGNRLEHSGPHSPDCDFEQLAAKCRTAAKAYFTSLGVDFQEGA